MRPDIEWQPNLIDLREVEDAFRFEEGYSRPDWKVLYREVRKRTTGSHELNDVWNEVVRQWLIRLREDLGGEYRVEESPHFFLLTKLSKEANGQVLSFSERTVVEIRERLKDAAWTSGHG